MEKANFTGASPEVSAYYQSWKPREKPTGKDSTTYGNTSQTANTPKGQSKENVRCTDKKPQPALSLQPSRVKAKSHAPEPAKVSPGIPKANVPKKNRAELPWKKFFASWMSRNPSCQECVVRLRPGKENQGEEIESIPAQVKSPQYIRYS